jgi:hypothetical protein
MFIDTIEEANKIAAELNAEETNKVVKPVAPVAPVVSAKTDIEIKKANIEEKINSLPDNLTFILHLTNSGNAENIYNSSLTMPGGVSSTTNIANKEQLKTALFDLAEGITTHRGYSDMFIGAIDKTILQNSPGKSQQDKLENYIDNNFIEDAAKTYLPSSLNAGYFTDGVLTTKYDTELAVLENKTEPIISEPVSKKQTEEELNKEKNKEIDNISNTIGDIRGLFLKLDLPPNGTVIPANGPGQSNVDVTINDNFIFSKIKYSTDYSHFVRSMEYILGKNAFSNFSKEEAKNVLAISKHNQDAYNKVKESIEAKKQEIINNYAAKLDALESPFKETPVQSAEVTELKEKIEEKAEESIKDCNSGGIDLSGKASKYRKK